MNMGYSELDPRWHVGDAPCKALRARVEQLEQSLTELIEWIDNRKFEQIHKYCGCTYCRTRETLRRNDGTN